MYEVFDPRDLDDAELTKRCYKLGNMIMAYRQSGHRHLVESMEITLAVMQEEAEYRTKKHAEDNEKEKEKMKGRGFKRKGKAKPKKKTDVITIGHIKGVDD